MTEKKNITTKRIASVMKENGVKKADLARALEITSSAITQKFQAQRFTLRDISRIADCFDISTDWLLGRTEQQKLPEKATK